MAATLMKCNNLYISTRTRYALRVLFELATHRGDTLSLMQISKNRSLPSKYAAQLMAPLRRAGYIASKPGPRGGFHILMPDSKINVLDVMETMDGPFHILRCLADPAVCRQREDCGTYRMWEQLDEQIRKLMASVTLARILRTYKRSEEIGEISWCFRNFSEALSPTPPKDGGLECVPPSPRPRKGAAPRKRRPPKKK